MPKGPPGPITGFLFFSSWVDIETSLTPVYHQHPKSSWCRHGLWEKPHSVSALLGAVFGGSPQPAPSAPRHPGPLVVMRASVYGTPNIWPQHSLFKPHLGVKNPPLLPQPRNSFTWSPSVDPSSLLCLSLLFCKLGPTNLVELGENRKRG